MHGIGPTSGGAAGHQHLQFTSFASPASAGGRFGDGDSQGTGSEILLALARSCGAVVLGEWELEDAALLDSLLELRQSEWWLVRVGVLSGVDGPLVVDFSGAGTVQTLPEFLHRLRCFGADKPVLVRFQATLAPEAELLRVVEAVAEVPLARFIVGEPSVSAASGAGLAERVGAVVVRVQAPTLRECEILAEMVLGGPCTAEVAARAWSAGALRRSMMDAVLRDGVDDGVLVLHDGVWVCARPWAPPGVRQLAHQDSMLAALGQEAADAVDFSALCGGLRVGTLVTLVGPEAVDEALEQRCLHWRGADRRVVALGGVLEEEAVIHRIRPGRAAALLDRAKRAGALARVPSRSLCRWMDLAGREPSLALLSGALLDATLAARIDLLTALGQERSEHLGDSEGGVDGSLQLALGMAVLGKYAGAKAIAERRPEEGAADGQGGGQGLLPQPTLSRELVEIQLDAAVASPLAVQRALESTVLRFRGGSIAAGALGVWAEAWIRTSVLSLALRRGVSSVALAGMEGGGGETTVLRDEVPQLMVHLLKGEVDATERALRALVEEEGTAGAVRGPSGAARRLICQGLLISGDPQGAQSWELEADRGSAFALAPQVSGALWPLLAQLEAVAGVPGEEFMVALGGRVSQARVRKGDSELGLACAAMAVAQARAGEPALARHWMEESALAATPSTWWGTQYAGVLLARCQRLLGHQAKAREILLQLITAEDLRGTATTRLMVLTEALRAGASEWWEDALSCAAAVDSALARALLDARAAGVRGDGPRAVLAAAALLRLGQAELVDTMHGWSTGAGQPYAGPWPDVKLSPRQLDIARRAAEGERSADVASTLGITRRTVESHLQQIYARLGLHSRVQLRAWLDAHPVGEQ